MSSQPSPIQQQMLKARDLIQQKQYGQARAILKGINHPKAVEWLAKIDEVELGDPFAGHVPARQQAPVYQQPQQYKSYTNAAVIVLILYFVLWVPGLIANIMYISEANRLQEEAGQSLPGVGALKWELAIFLIVPIILVLVFAIILPLLTMNTSAIYQNIVSSL